MMTKKIKDMKQNRKYILIIMLIIILPGIWFLFLQNNEIGTSEAKEILNGEWQRSDGPYTIKISDVLDEGKLSVAYLNPNPINIGESGWRVKDDVLQIYVELQDVNYPGSLYDLNYNKDKNILSGTYYQAVDKESYTVIFERK